MLTTRRGFIAGAAAATAIVLGFDPSSRNWVTEAAARPHDPFPDIDGTLTTDPSTLALYAVDIGNDIHRTPIAVLYPANARDIQKAIRYCRRHRIKVAGRGHGHTTFGQSQVQGGLVIDMATLNQIHSIGSNRAVIGAGASWRDLVTAGLGSGVIPPVLTGYINLSIGGTLSVGGISTSYKEGAQVDHVRELEVVTGKGDIVRCTAKKHDALFQAALAGLGQCGIITQATVDMVPALPHARVMTLNYFTDAPFFQDLRTLLNREEVDDVFMLGVPDGAGGWVRQLNAVKFHDTGDDPDPNFLLRDLTVPVPAATVADQSRLEYVLRVDVLVDFLKLIGQWDGVPHPWFDAWLPDETVEPYFTDVLSGLTPADVGPTGFLLLLPQKASAFKRKFLRVPRQTDWIYLFDILTAGVGPGDDPVFSAAMLDRNRTLFEQARDLGGTRYPIGSLEFSKQDWAEQYGRSYRTFKRLKRRYDPNGILTPGPGIF
jgi:cytokinin dehydrogenase